MQQFASAARSQSRPPLAMMPWMAEDAGKKKKVKGTSALSTTSSAAAQRSLRGSSAWSATTTTLSSPQPPSPSSNACRRRPSQPPANLASLSLSSVAEDASHLEHALEDTEEEEPDTTALVQQSKSFIVARNFQAMIQTRRSTTHFDTTLTATDGAAFWKDALDRAVACGRRAPNHKRTEAFSFKRILSPSVATERLAEIAYRVTLDKSQSEVNAERKRTKWSQIPAYLVAMVRAPNPLYPEYDDDEALLDEQGLLYRPLDFVAPQTEREMEDYASTCAAVQNVLLSLHAEHIASKWATGPVIQTPAFRRLVGATSRDRIVALVMVGLPKTAAHSQREDSGSHEETTRQQQRHRREWDEVLQDL